MASYTVVTPGEEVSQNTEQIHGLEMGERLKRQVAQW